MLFPLLMAQTAFATDIIYQADIQGGVSVDATGVDAHEELEDMHASAEDLHVQIPRSAEPIQGYLILHAKLSGFGAVTGSGGCRADAVHFVEVVQESGEPLASQCGLILAAPVQALFLDAAVHVHCVLLEEAAARMWHLW